VGLQASVSSWSVREGTRRCVPIGSRRQVRRTVEDSESLALFFPHEFVEGARRLAGQRVVDCAGHSLHLRFGHHVIQVIHPGSPARGDAGANAEPNRTACPPDGPAPFLDVTDVGCGDHHRAVSTQHVQHGVDPGFAHMVNHLSSMRLRAFVAESQRNR
jgi:hypothetical protein